VAESGEAESGEESEAAVVVMAAAEADGKNGFHGLFFCPKNRKRSCDNLAGKRARETPKSPDYPIVISTIGRNRNSTQ